MPTFNDNAGGTWSLALDGLLLADLREQHKIDLADVTGPTYALLERDAAQLATAVCFLCADQLQAQQLTRRQLSQRLVGDVLDRAFETLLEAAKVFFPARQRSALASALSQYRDAQAKWDQLGPMLQMLNRPDMPPAMKDAVLAALEGMMRQTIASGSPRSEERPSATGPEGTPSTPASPWPATADRAPAA
jgi:hypothetical protein